MKKLIFFITILLATIPAKAGEMVLEWKHQFGSHVSAFNILPGGDDVLLTLHEGKFEIRSIADGSLKEDYELQIEGIDIHYAQITPDSSRVLIAYGGHSDFNTSFELINLEDFSSINRFEIPLEGDSTSEEGNKYVNRFTDIEIDPIRPLVYFVLKKALPVKTIDDEKEFYTIKTFNYESGEEIREIKKYKDDHMMMIDVSDDGKYLASINNKEAYINVWDLQTFNQIRSYQLFRNSPDLTWKTDVRDMKFSENRSDIIYFSGLFSRIGNPNEFENGVFEYSIERGNHINILPDNNYTGRLIFAENEKILFLNSGFTYLFFDFLNKTREYLSLPNNENSISSYAIYSQKYKSFIGASGRGAVEKEIRSIKYLTQTNVEKEDQNDKIIYPNPTTNNIKIKTSCELNRVQLVLMDVNGTLLLSETIPITQGYVSLNLSEFPSGSYFIRLFCGEELNTYTVIKEG